MGRFRASFLTTLPAIRWPLLGVGGLALAWVLTLQGREPVEVELEDIPDRFVKVVVQPQPELPPPPVVARRLQPAEPREAPVPQSKLLLKALGTTGEPTRVQDLWSDEEQGLGDIDRVLRQSTGVAASIGDLAGVGGGMGAIAETWPRLPPNGFDATTADRLSTFSIDVDTASWTRVRRQLATGFLPVPGMVRVEEFVNYFPYDYRPPELGRPFEAHVLGAPALWNPERTLLRIGLQGYEVSVFDRKPANLTFLVDVSCSMQGGDRLELVKEGLHALTDELRDVDMVALVTYAGGSRVVLRPTPATERATIHRAIDELAASGGTSMAQGIFTAYDLASSVAHPNTIDRVIIASDGDANIGPSHHSQITPTIRRYALEGITLTTLGVGTGNYRDHNMEQLANDGDGNYFYLDSQAEARRVLVDRLTSTLQVIARDVKVQVEFDPDAVASYRLVGYENRDIADRDFRNDAVDAGEVGAGHQVTALYELALTDHVTAPLGALRLRHKPPGPDAPSTESVWTIERDVLRTSFEETNSDYRIAAIAGTFAEILRGSPHVDFDLQRLEALARASRRPEYPQDQELVDAIARAAAAKAPTVARRPGRPVVSAEAGQVGTSGDTAAVQAVIRRYSGQLTYCYEKRLKAQPELQGRMELAWSTSGGKVVGKPLVLANATGDVELADCVTNKVRRWVFPADVSGTVTWPFVFRQ